MVSRYRGKRSPRPSQATTPTTPQSEATLPPSLDGDPGQNNSPRLNTETGKRKPSVQGLGSSGYKHGGDVESSEPHIMDTDYSPCLSPFQNVHFEAAAELDSTSEERK